MTWYRRLANLFRSDRLARDIEREMAFHLAERTDDLVRHGMSEAEARREARRRFGHHAVLRDRVHDVDALVWLESLAGDARHAIRTLRANPGFTVVAVLSLGLGIGANTAIFSLINAVMLRSLPVPEPEQLVQLTISTERFTSSNFTNPLWEQIRDREDETLAGTFAFADNSFNLTNGGVVRRVAGAVVSGDYFHVLGVAATAGRVLGRSDDTRGCPGAAVLSYGFWQREYGGAPDAIGRTISINGHPIEIVGVAASGFAGTHIGRAPGVFLPICIVAQLRNDGTVLDSRSFWFLNVFGRMHTGRSLAEAQASLAAATGAILAATVPTHWTPDEQTQYRNRTLNAVAAANGMSRVRGQYRDALFTLLVVVGVVLIVACANVAQLLLARGAARQREIALRLALGSSRVRLARQLVTESVLLGLLGAALGTLFARWSSELVLGFLSVGGTAVSLDLSLDPRVLGFTIVVATTTGILFGLVPAWRTARVDPQVAMRGPGHGVVGHSRQRLSKGIVIGQVTLSLVLITAAGLLIGSFRSLTTLDPGFRSDNVILVDAGWSNLDLGEERQAGFPRELLEQTRAVGGVRRASASLITPISGTTWTEDVVVEGVTPPDGRPQTVWFNAVSDGFLDTFGTALLAGRDFTVRDRANAAPVVLVNQTMARRAFGDDNPLGARIRTTLHDSLGPSMEIVGVVEDAKYARLDEDPRPSAYVPLEQTALWGPRIALSIQSEVAPAALIPAVTDAMRELHPGIALEFTTLRDQVATSLARPRLLATLSGFFGGLALLLSVIGLYGTMSYSVARRRNEIGVRMALGATRSGVLRMVAVEAGVLVVVGLAAGTLLALSATRLVAAFLYGVTPSDPATLALSALTLAAVAMAAGLLPAWRAASVDPRAELRAE